MRRQGGHLKSRENQESKRTGSAASSLTHSLYTVRLADTVLGGHNNLSNSGSLIFSEMVGQPSGVVPNAIQ